MSALRVFLLILAMFSNSAFANEAWHQCFAQMEAKYQLPKYILKTIAHVESNFNPRAVNRNRNSRGEVVSEDIGVMQINTQHLSTLSRYGIKKRDLWDPCTNIQVGAWILWDNIKRIGWNWNAIGAYNARSPHKRRIYVAKIAKAWKKYHEPH